MELAVCVSAFYQMLLELSSAFTRPTAETFRQLAVAWLLTPGVGPVTGMTRTLGASATKHWTAYQKFFYRAAWSLEDVANRVLVRLVAPHLGSTVHLNLDDTTCGPRGRHVALASWFKDASAHARAPVFHWAHQWVIGAISLRPKALPGRRLSLPVAFALYRKRADCDPALPYATLPQLALRLVRHVAEALPGKHLFVAVDGLYAVRAFFGNLPPGVVAVSRLRKDAALRTAQVPKRRPGCGGCPRQRGDRLPPLPEIARRARRWQRVTLQKQGRQVVRLLHGFTCQWWHVCRQRPVRVILVHDPSGVEDDLWLVCNDPTVPDAAIAQRYVDRWGIEECIEEAKQHLGMEQTRGVCARTVSRQAPLAMLLGTLVKLWYVDQAAGRPTLAPAAVPWYPQKRGPSFRDMLAAWRRVFWRHRVWNNSHHGPEFHKAFEALAYALCEAA
jgi:hypothetical protein